MTEVKIHLGAAFKLETIVVEGQRLPATVSRTEIRGSELLRIPGTTNDALRGLTTLPSIGIPNDYFRHPLYSRQWSGRHALLF